MKKLALGFAVLLFGFHFWNPGVVFEVETTFHAGGEALTTTMSVEEGIGIRTDILPGARQKARSEAIFRSDRREMIIVEHGQKSYMVIDEAAMQAMAGQVNAAMKQVEEMMKNLPEAQRKIIEEAQKRGGVGMPGMAAPPKTVEKEYKNTGERATKAGYPCVRYEVLEDGVKTRELWVTDWDKVEGAAEVKAAFAEMASFYKNLMASFSDAVGPIGGTSDPFASFTEIDGFPVVTRDFDAEGALESESTLRSATRRTLDPADFEPPAGYKRQSMMGG